MKFFLSVFLFSFAITSVSAQTFTPPYFDDFETGAPGWLPVINSGGGASLWELGDPQYGSTTGSYSGSNCWDINLDSGYSNSGNASLISPKFDLSNSTSIELSFWTNYKTEPSWDGFRIEYVTDSVGQWNLLGNVNSPYSLNWYTNATLYSSGLPGWAGNSAGWIQSTIITSAVAGEPEVWFRFVFTSDLGVTDDGVSIDDFRINLSNMNTISGSVFYDTNGNNTIDSTDTPLPNININFNPFNGFNTVPTNSYGFYENLIDSGISYTITPDLPLYTTVQPASYSVQLNGSGLLSPNNNFLISLIPGINDLVIEASGGIARPGFTHNCYLHFYNEGFSDTKWNN